jgi:hypothetical protein
MADDDPKADPPRFNAEEILRTVAEIRTAIQRFAPDVLSKPKPEDVIPDERVLPAGVADADTLEIFEQQAVADALQTVAEELDEALTRVNEKLYQDALAIYYAAEELARDPAHADLIPRVEEMRRAYEQSYGRPIPPKGSK